MKNTYRHNKKRPVQITRNREFSQNDKVRRVAVNQRTVSATQTERRLKAQAEHRSYRKVNDKNRYQRDTVKARTQAGHTDKKRIIAKDRVKRTQPNKQTVHTNRTRQVKPSYQSSTSNRVVKPNKNSYRAPKQNSNRAPKQSYRAPKQNSYRAPKQNTYRAPKQRNYSQPKSASRSSSKSYSRSASNARSNRSMKQKQR